MFLIKKDFVLTFERGFLKNDVKRPHDEFKETLNE